MECLCDIRPSKTQGLYFLGGEPYSRDDRYWDFGSYHAVWPKSILFVVMFY